MRYDSDPYIIKKIITEAETLQKFLSNPRLGGTISPHLFDELELLLSSFVGTIDHFAQLHALNPQFSVSRFSANTIEQKLLSLRTSITELFTFKQFDSLYAQAEWHKTRFLVSPAIHDNEQILIALYKKLAQVLETYDVERVRQTHFAALLNEVVGWSEHIETQGHHDIHGVILFAEKIARYRAIIEHRVEIVREICVLLQDRGFLKEAQATLEQTPGAASELSRIYSPYLLELYAVLLEDMEIIAIAARDYEAFESYCRERQIEVYEEYRDVIHAHLRRYVEGIAIAIPPAFQMVKTANIMVNVELTCERYQEVETTADILGVNLTEDIRILQQAITELQRDYPEIVQTCVATIQKVKALKKEIIKPAIQVYGQYMNEPEEFFEKLPLHQTEWILVLESAMACLEPDDELYRKCSELKNRIDQFGVK
jgi:hypothetical protein